MNDLNDKVQSKGSTRRVRYKTSNNPDRSNRPINFWPTIFVLVFNNLCRDIFLDK